MQKQKRQQNRRDIGNKEENKDKLIGTEYVARHIEKEEGVDMQPGSKLAIRKVKLDV